MYDRHIVSLAGQSYEVLDARGSIAVSIIGDELLRDGYHLQQLELTQGDTVVDVGGHVGLFAIYCATRWPGVRIHSFEPFPENADLFEKNIESSGLRNITLHWHAITGDGSATLLTGCFGNSGGASNFSHRVVQTTSYEIAAKTLDGIFEEQQIDVCALLKIDCEGAEYEILKRTQILERVKFLRGELHINKWLLNQDHTPRSVAQRCLQFLPKTSIRFSVCRIDD